MKRNTYFAGASEFAQPEMISVAKIALITERILEDFIFSLVELNIFIFNKFK